MPRAIDITAALVDRWIETRLATGGAPGTINRSTQVFGQAFKLAVERGQLSSAPKLRHLPERNARTGFFAEREFRTVMENLPAQVLPKFSVVRSHNRDSASAHRNALS
jgi:hypothetical protein